MRRLTVLLCAAALCLTGTGCASIYSGYREVEQLQLIQTIGIDVREEGTTLSISSGQVGSVSATTMSCTGGSITDAMRQLQSFSPREDIFYAHTRYAVLGEDTAVSGVGGVLDFIGRAGQIRLDIGLFVLRDGTAEDLITRSTGKSTNITDILASLERTASRDGTSQVFTCQQILRALAQRGSALICALSAQETEGVIFSEAGELAAVTAGYGLLKGDALCGYITGESARGVNLLLGRGSLGTVEVEIPRRVCLDTGIGSCRVRPLWQGDRLAALEISCQLDCALAELEDIAPPTAEEYEAMAQALSEKAEGWIRTVLELQRLHDADFLGLCDRIRAAAPGAFAKAEADWPAALRDTEYRIHVTARIQRDYDLRAPLK